MEKLTYEQYKEKKENKGILVVDCYADWCGPCKSLMPMLDKMSEENTDESLSFYKVNVDTDGEISVKESVRGLPTVLILKDGEVKEKIVGLKTPDFYKERIKSVKNG